MFNLLSCKVVLHSNLTKPMPETYR